MQRMSLWRPPRWFRVWMLLASRIGDGWLWCAAGVLVFILGGPQSYVAVVASALAVCSSAAIFLILKPTFGRLRPCMVERHCWVKLFPPDRFSFPSGHTMIAFAVASSLGLFFPSILLPLTLSALSVGVSRVVLGLHFLSDVLVGAAAGAALGLLSVALFRPLL